MGKMNARGMKVKKKKTPKKREGGGKGKGQGGERSGWILDAQLAGPGLGFSL